MLKASMAVPGGVLVVPAIPYEYIEAHENDDLEKWYEFVHAHVAGLQEDLQDQIPESMKLPNGVVTSNQGLYKRKTPISASLVSHHWFDIDTNYLLAEVLRHQVADTVIDGTFGEREHTYARTKQNFCAALFLFWNQASWLALHRLTDIEMYYPWADTGECYFDVVDGGLAELMFEDAFLQCCLDNSNPYHAQLQGIYEATVGKQVDSDEVTARIDALADDIEKFIRVEIALWKMGKYT